MYSLRSVVHSEVGRVRKNNQDSCYASPNLLLVADGMGGAAAGDLASAVAVTELAKADRRLSGADMLELLAGALDRANERITDIVMDDPALDGMGTTVCGALFSGTQLGLVHIGDSRGYLLRAGKLTQITHDHSWVQSLIDQGKITPEQAETHPHRSLLLRVLNGQPRYEPVFELVDVQLGDRIMFCSDGLSGLIFERDLAELLATPDLNEAVSLLAAAANDAGGVDNITMVVADVVEADDALDKVPPVSAGAATQVTIPTPGLVESPSQSAPLAKLDAEAERYMPQPKRFRWLGTTLILLLVAAVLTCAALVTVSYVKTKYFVGVSDGKVAIFRGIPADAVLGFKLNEVVEVQDIRSEDLPKFYQGSVSKGISVPDMAAARTTTAELQEKARGCIAVRQQRERSKTNPVPPTEPPPPPTGPSAPPTEPPAPPAEPSAPPTPVLTPQATTAAPTPDQTTDPREC